MRSLRWSSPGGRLSGIRPADALSSTIPAPTALWRGTPAGVDLSPPSRELRPRGEHNVPEKVRFKSVVGPELSGVIDLPEGEIRGWGIFVHGFTLGKNSPAASRVSKQLAREGIGMLRYDNLGLGDSEGDWGDGSFTVKVQDTIRAAALMAERGTPADLLVGHSWGGSAAIAAAAVATGVRAVATIGAPGLMQVRVTGSVTRPGGTAWS
ncbi:alpha/beta hydrolase family protein [Streptomyces sp. 3213.3]|uniref:alpha/beta hydrolase family protein n=1 Tax=Streptomyces sp. 3213.3 TaxID=1855348 RepID=UPI001F174D60|nr:alpha/beta fold hydrolase [Streptomyces sp. 3213.3]